MFTFRATVMMFAIFIAKPVAAAPLPLLTSESPWPTAAGYRAAVPSLQPERSLPSGTCFARTADGGINAPVSFVALSNMSFRNESQGKVDFVLDHAAGMPEPSKLHAATADEDAMELFNQLHALSRRRVVKLSEVSLITRPPEYGAGSTLHMLIFPVLESLIEGRTLFWPHLALWAPKDCAAQDLSCYFDALPSLSQFTVDWRHGALRRLDEVEEQGRTPRGRQRSTLFIEEEIAKVSDGDNTWMTKSDHPEEHPLARQLRKGCSSRPSLPEELLFNKQQTTSSCGVRTLDLDPGPMFEHYDEVALFAKLNPRFLRHGRFWLISQVLHFLTRPNARLQADLDQKRSALRLRPPSLSLHIRKGDACTHRGDCRDLKYYMPRIEALVSRYGLKSIFLSTPSADVIQDTANYPHLHFAHTPTTPTTAILRAHNLTRIEEGLGLGLIDTGLEFRAYMVDIYLLAEGAAFLGAFTSNAARLAYSLMSAGNQGCLKPYESADINWCYGVCKGGAGVIRYNDRACESDPKCDNGSRTRIAC